MAAKSDIPHHRESSPRYVLRLYPSQCPVGKFAALAINIFFAFDVFIALLMPCGKRLAMIEV